MHAILPQDCSRIAQDLQIRKLQVEAVVHLFDEGNTVPYIARYRREHTGGLKEEQLRQIQVRVNFLRQLHDRKQTILKHIENQGKLTPELREAILQADTTRRLEDLYLPYKTKKRGLAAAARDKGLEPVALALWHSDAAVGSLEELLPALVNPEKQLAGPDDVRTGVQHILAEMIAESADIRAPVRSLLWETAKVCAGKHEKLPEGHGLEYKDYFQFTESARQIPPHRILALNRGEKEQALQIRLEYAKDKVSELALAALAALMHRQFGKMPPPAPPPAAPPAAVETSPTAETPAETPGAAGAETSSPAPAAAPAAAAPSPEGGMASATEASGAAASEPVAEPAASTTPSPPAPPSEPPASEMSSAAPSTPPEAAPLVASMAPQAPAEMTGEQLSPQEPFKTPHAGFLRTVLEDALNRLLLPSLEREIRHELTDEAEAHAVAVFARNLRSLLMQPPLRQRRVLAFDPNLRGGSKLAALDEHGNLLEHATVYPFGPPPARRGRDRGPKNQPAQPSSAAPGATPAPAATPEAAGPSAAVAPPVEVPSPADVAPPANEPAAAEATPLPGAEAFAAANIGSAAANPPPENTHAPAATEPSVEVMPSTATTTTPNPEMTAPAAAVIETPPAAATPPPPEPDRKAETKGKIRDLVKRHQISVVALGNGAGCREIEEMLADLISADLPDLAYVLVSEAGASVYALSPLAREELPTHDVALRSAISIGRRLQDPLSELVKIDPQHVGVGLYQHDMSRKDLKESLDNVVTSCVNQVGVDVNSAGVALLRHVAGLNPMAARELVEHRKQHGAFVSRAQLKELPALGPQRATQAAAFLRIPQAPNALDRTWIHPDDYPRAEQLLAEAGHGAAALEDPALREDLHAKLKAVNIEETARKLHAATGTVEDMIDDLMRPGYDPRDELPPPVFKKGILRIEDLQPGMELKGTVLNVVDFGAFVDVGLKDSGLVHISQIANRYVKSPYEVVAVHDVVTVWVLTVDKERHRVSLTMIKPGTERKPQERRPAPRREEGGRPPRGPRPGGAPQGQPREGQPRQEGAGGRGPRPPRGRPGPGPGRGPAPRGPQHADAPAGEGGGPAGRSGPPPRPAFVPRKPRREPPKPKLSQTQLEGKVPLRTFSELSALFAAKKDDKKPAEQPAAPPGPTGEQPGAAALPVEAVPAVEAAPAVEAVPVPAAPAPAVEPASGAKPAAEPAPPAPAPPAPASDAASSPPVVELPESRREETPNA